MGASRSQKTLARFLAPKIELKSPYFLSPEESHHLKDVLRLKEGTWIRLLDLEGKEFLARVEKLGKKVLVRAEKILRQEPPPKVQVILLLPLLKKELLSFLVEKAVELGITEIIPFYSSRTIVKASPKLREKLEKRALQSLKQCGRLWPLKIYQPLSLREALSLEAEKKIVAYEREEKVTLKNILESFSAQKLLLASGPEGGFSEEEISLLKDAGFLSVSLGPLTLRAETAAFYLMCVSHLLFFQKS